MTNIGIYVCICETYVKICALCVFIILHMYIIQTKSRFHRRNRALSITWVRQLSPVSAAPREGHLSNSRGAGMENRGFMAA